VNLRRLLTKPPGLGPVSRQKGSVGENTYLARSTLTHRELQLLGMCRYLDKAASLASVWVTNHNRARDKVQFEGVRR
jgi:hypothetical protein